MLDLIADSERWPLSGDNLLVDMGLDKESLPTGSRLSIGDTVVVEISEEPHTGCAKFSARFGSDALKFINSPEGRELRLRGVNAHVIVPGTISPGRRRAAHPALARAYARRIASTRAFHEPLGASTSTTSPTAAPISAEPSGESGETPPTAEISTSIASPSSSAISTIEPTPTCSSVSCSTVTAWVRRSRSARIRASRRPCSFFAAWYSKFSDRSPNSRAVLIA